MSWHFCATLCFCLSGKCCQQKLTSYSFWSAASCHTLGFTSTTVPLWASCFICKNWLGCTSTHLVEFFSCLECSCTDPNLNVQKLQILRSTWWLIHQCLSSWPLFRTRRSRRQSWEFRTTACQSMKATSLTWSSGHFITGFVSQRFSSTARSLACLWLLSKAQREAVIR